MSSGALATFTKARSTSGKRTNAAHSFYPVCDHGTEATDRERTQSHVLRAVNS